MFRMGEYIDFHANFLMFLQSLDERRNQSEADEERSRDRKSQRRIKRRRFLDPHIYRVRPCVCVTGFSKAAIQKVKDVLGRLTDDPLPLESFHVTRETDVKDGALLVPKLILVAVHCPGRKLIDDKDDEGQLDFIYDEAIQVGADVLVIYLDLPKVIYSPAKNYIYHPRVADLLFPSQPILQTLAMNSSLITVTEKSDFNPLQRNLLREWITRPIPTNHRIYRTAQYLSEYSVSDADWWSENEASAGSQQTTTRTDVLRRLNRGFLSATEEHPVTNRKSKKYRKSYGTARTTETEMELHRPLVSGMEDSVTLELELYNDDFCYRSDSHRVSEQV